MNRLKETFPNRKHVILPVIHVENEPQALRNAEFARSAGCDGVFLINHEGRYTSLLKIHKVVVRELPGWWVGVNCLDLEPEEAFEEIDNSVAGIWTDNAGIDEELPRQEKAESVLAVRQGRGWGGLYFGGVDFKGQPKAADLRKVARLATGFMDVITTSGPATGSAPSTRKVATMKEAVGEHPLAIASGITPENVGDYLPYADCFLVASGISWSWTELDPARVQTLVEAVR